LAAEGLVLGEGVSVLVQLGEEETFLVFEFEDLLGDLLTATDDIFEFLSGGLDIGIIHQGILSHRILQRLVLLCQAQMIFLEFLFLTLNLVFKSFCVE